MVGAGEESSVRHALVAMVVISAIGIAGYAAASRLALIPAAVVLDTIVVFKSQFSIFWGMQPRFLYPVISAIALMLVAGIDELLPARAKGNLGWAWAIMGVINLVAPVDCMYAYARLT
jgi:phosphoglycerol transferase MdoB-like AlkP superfamily enzyme